MKKKVLSIILSILIIFTFSISNIPLNELNTVYAETNVATNFIDFLRTNLGLAKVNNGSLSNVSRDDFAQSLYNTPLVWTDNGVNFSFTPSDEFSKSQWNQMCIYGGSEDTRFVDFDLQECLIKSQYIEDNGSGINLSKFPKLSDNTNTSSPLDGIEIKTNFSDFSYGQTDVPLYGITADYIKSDVSSNSSSYIIYSGKTSKNGNVYIYKTAFIGLNDVDYYALVRNNVNSNNSQYYIASFYNNTWSQVIGRYSALLTRTSYSGNNLNVLYYSSNPSYIYTANNLSFSDSNITYGSSGYGTDLYYPTTYFDDIKFYSNKPIVFASSYQFAQNYFYWLRGTPDGSFYSTSNTNTVYNYDYINNNNWETAYNNYITDVSNYYSTTENITNEQLSNYIDQSTTITNITNNYINNNQGGSGEDDIITNSWLERIFNILNEIKDILLGKNVSDPDDEISNLTDDSIKNDLLRFPAENLFPDLNDEDIITPEDIIENDNKIPWDLITSKMGSVISEVVPFCYIFQMKSLFLALSAPPQDPYFEIPFYIERLGIDEYVTIDLTAQAWDNLHTIWITLFLIIFLAFLFYLTHKILMLISNMFV